MICKFPYTKLALHSLKKPFPQYSYNFYAIQYLSIRNGSHRFKTTGMIDTGAQYCFLHPRFSRLLGIDDFKDTKYKSDIYGIGGPKIATVAYFHDVELIVYTDYKKHTDKNSWIIKTKIGILEKPIVISCVLGSYGFLDHFSFYGNIPKGYYELEHLHES